MYSKELGEKSILLSVVNICIVLGLIILLSFTASVSLNLLYSIRVEQITFFSCGIIVIGGFHVFSLLLAKKIHFDITIVDAILVTSILYMGLDRYFGQNSSGFSLRFIEIFGLSILYVFLRCNLTSYRFFLFACVLGCIAQSLYGLSQLYHFYPSNNENFLITGSFFNPGPLSGYVLYGLCISIGLYLFKDNIAHKTSLTPSTLTKKAFDVLFYCFIIGMICCLLVLFACKSRASWFGLILCCTILFYNYRCNDLWKQFNLKSKVWIFILASIILLAIISSLYFINQNSSDGRLFVWKVTTEIVSKNPVTGVGFDNFCSNYMSYQQKYFELNPLSNYKLVAGDIKYPFNILMSYITENGIIGFILFIVILGRIFLIKETNSITIISKAALSGQLIFAFFSYSEQILPIKLNIVCSLAFLASKDAKFISYEMTTFKFKLFKWPILLTYLICSIFCADYIDKLVRCYKNWETGFQIYSSGQYLEAVPFFSSAYPFLKRDGEFLMQYGNSLLKANKLRSSLKMFNESETYFNNYPLQIAKGNCYRKLKKTYLAMTCYKKAANMVPSRLYPKYLQSIYFLELNKKESAIKLALFILEMPVKINSPAINEMKANMYKIIANQDLSSDEILSILNRSSTNGT